MIKESTDDELQPLHCEHFPLQTILQRIPHYIHEMLTSSYYNYHEA